eukprot:CAMPEP_0114586814 /NCGR_PEP_ID=MMETSP0125-20121206/9937_1 /TAXON_ID=485358 ORGANISM="Aristerostoma sp., Strain ATCC 50986" /NCGR_SAMPLE_ID=MMETSP0125 /ASSEMBLY_ACC=CAM_ASM_000245 /LENGTH=154 /DNA_ID=CAMNT_0001782427 /DNA_START=31 /DNA_END=495 /DNA_ORIENTATION=-
MSTPMRRRLRHMEEWEYKRGYTEEELRASALRKKFVSDYIVHADTNLYKTQVERDWAYIAKREYNYDVKYTAMGWGFFYGNIACTINMFLTKRVTYSLLPIVGFVGYLYTKPQLYQMHNKKLFDMCNVGEQYALGAARNRVLRQCNQILDVEDF